MTTFYFSRKLTLTSTILASAFMVLGQTVEPLRFEDNADLARLQVKGSAVIDAEQKHAGNSSLRLDPGASVTLPLRDFNGSGKIEIWVYDGMAQPADPKSRLVGPRWGFRQSDGRTFVSSQLFAPYLAGDTNYTLSESADGRVWYTQVTYLGECRRSEGWHKWTFDFNAETGLKVLFNDRDVNAARRRFDASASQMAGFSSLVLFGSEDKDGWPIWVDDITVELGPPVEEGAGEAPSVVPETDPAPDAAVALIYPDLTAHPRLLFGREEIEKMRTYMATPAAKLLMDRLIAYRNASRPDGNDNFLRDATDGQRQGFWRMPTVALHYLLTGDEASLRDAIGFIEKFNKHRHWELGDERDSGMSAANIMIGAALTFDWVYDKLDPELRESFRRKLWHHARAMYYGGHLKKNPAIAYWQNDPQNNHRWHRDAGMILCAFAAARGEPQEQWLLGEIKREMEFIARWLPNDGTSHESPSYLVFGGAHLFLALQASDRGFGTSFLELPFVRNAGHFRIQTIKPGFQDAFLYGDGGGFGGYNGFYWKAAAVYEQGDIMAGLDRLQAVTPSAFEFAWFDVIWRDPNIETGRIESLPTRVVFPDVGTVIVRDNWSDNAVAAMFRSCPLGGYTLNRFRNEHDFMYINVAHDDPDANSFVINVGPRTVLETDGYSYSKKSANHNTVLVNGIGQEALGRAEGGQWNQPATGQTDMSRMAYLTAWKQQDKFVIAEGEAAGAYLALNDSRRNAHRPALERFRRTFVWVEGEYLLVLDDLEAPQEVTYDWLMQGYQIEQIGDDQENNNENANLFRLSNDGASCTFQFASDCKMETVIRDSPADSRGKSLGLRQLKATAQTRRLRIATVFAPWSKRGEVRVKLEPLNDRQAVVLVRHGQDTATWNWSEAADNKHPSIVWLVADGQTVVRLDWEDTPPEPEGDPAW